MRTPPQDLGGAHARGEVVQARERRSAQLESLRGLASCAVVLCHVLLFGPNASFELPAALSAAVARIVARFDISVSVFFALTGYLLFKPFAASIIQQRNAPHIPIYYRNRILRILPLYYAVLIVTAVVLYHPLLTNVGLLLRFLAFAQNFSADTYQQYLGVSWTLVLEVTFYALLPVFAWAPLRQRLTTLGLRWMVLILGGLFALSAGATLFAHLYYNLVRHVPGGVPVWQEALFPFEFYLFVPGMLIAVLACRPERLLMAFPVLRHRAIWLLAAAAGFAAVVGGPQQARYPLSTIPAAFLVGALALELDGSERVLVALAWRPLACIGVISYGIYLWHLPLVQFLGMTGWLKPGSFYVNAIEVLVATIALSTLSYVLVERPFLLLRKRWFVARQPGSQVAGTDGAQLVGGP